MSNRLSIEPRPVSGRAFRGLGVQADAFLYDQTNRDVGVNDADYELVESRLLALRPGVVRIFVPLDHFNPSFDAATYDWDLQAFANLRRHLGVVQRAGAKVNVCMGPWTNGQMQKPGMEKAAVDLVERLTGEEGFDNVAWLSLYNEPDSLFWHDSPLYKRIWPKADPTNRPPWEQCVAQHRRAQELLIRRGLYPRVKLIVADTVWGHAVRAERMAMSVRDFGDLDVSFSYHHYNVEFQDRWCEGPDFRHPGTGVEAGMFREMVGADRELMVWEFNNAGIGFGSHFPGVTMDGEDILSSVRSGPDVAGKVLDSLPAGLDGMSLWCLGDMHYNCGPKHSPMRFGLWRFRWEGWRPRPHYAYYAALVEAFRPGAAVHRVAGLSDGLSAASACAEGQWHVALLNRQGGPTRVRLSVPDAAGPAQRLRVSPGRLPVDRAEPPQDWAPLPVSQGDLELDLDGSELTVIRLGRS